MDELKLSVRALVEFTLHGEDIRPGGSIKDMQEGMLGHKARQGLLGAGWEAERPVAMPVDIPGEVPWVLLVTGRMDAWREEPPCVEEIKLWQGREAPLSPIPAHRAQGVCYGCMICREKRLPSVTVRVTYVDRRGREKAVFEETLTVEECRAAFDELVAAFVAREELRRSHERTRNASLKALRFPYDRYRAGQREMAVQVYTAIKQRRRLFASMPTGTGKSSAALFPALKALGEGLTGQLFYLTARTTQRQAALEAVARMRAQQMDLWVLTLSAKDRQCPHRTVCHPDWCPRAKGHFLRDNDALLEMLFQQDWTPEAITARAAAHELCPFEFSLALAELADVVICDYNYAFDPAVHIQRIFDQGSNVTLLVDEAHNLLSRTRDMLSGTLDADRIRRLRRMVGKTAGRRHPLYKAMTELLKCTDDVVLPEGADEGRVPALPSALPDAVGDVVDALAAAGMESFPFEEAGEKLSDVLMELVGFLRTTRRDPAGYAFLCQGREDPRITALALEVAAHLREVTAPLHGVVCFSATFEPLPEMKTLLGGEEEDACFAMPSPFPEENLLIVQERIDTRYAARGASAPAIAAAIRTLVQVHPGKYIVYFPSFAFLRLVAEELNDTPHQRQEPKMDDAAREAFLRPYREGNAPVLSLCVLGGVFAEGIDLPGAKLDGVCVVGMGLPQVNLFTETLRTYYDETLQKGFLYAYQIPGMQKVAQAVGRVIRTEEDRGVALLLDDRYSQRGYQALLPAHWRILCGHAAERLRAFYL